MVHTQESLFDWKRTSSPSIPVRTPVILHKPELCPRCDIQGRAMCGKCRDAEREEKEESHKPLTSEEIRAFFQEA